MFKVVIAPDKFRGSLSATEAAHAMSLGVKRASPEAIVECVPMADGGEGTVRALVDATSGILESAIVSDPLGRPICAEFGRLGDRKTAVIEMASASGLALLSNSERDPGRTTTRGTGELLLKAIETGARKVLIGIGGSATNDGGAGLGQALGYQLLDRDGDELGPGGLELSRLDRIDASGRDARLEGIEIAIACDVTNPLCGPTGASVAFGPQKGADAALVRQLDRNLAHFAAIIRRDFGIDILEVPGAGAAGGLGGGLLAFSPGHLQPGIDLVIETLGLADSLRDADLCLTGEGSIDQTTALGKTVVGVARLAASFGCPTIAIAGHLGEQVDRHLPLNVNAVFSICPRPIGLEEAIQRAAELLANASEQIIRAFLIGRKSAKPGDRPNEWGP